MTTTDYAQLKAARELLTRIPLPLDVEAGETPGTPYTVTHDGTAEHGTATAVAAGAAGLVNPAPDSTLCVLLCGANTRLDDL